MRKVFIGNGERELGLARKGILETIQKSGNRGLNVYELSWFSGADIFVILKALKQLKRDLISVRATYATHWCYPPWGVA